MQKRRKHKGVKVIYEGQSPVGETFAYNITTQAFHKPALGGCFYMTNHALFAESTNQQILYHSEETAYMITVTCTFFPQEDSDLNEVVMWNKGLQGQQSGASSSIENTTISTTTIQPSLFL